MNPDLIVLKQNAGRPRDQEDIAALRPLADTDEDDAMRILTGTLDHDEASLTYR